jgi:hypothetical protein
MFQHGRKPQPAASPVAANAAAPPAGRVSPNHLWSRLATGSGAGGRTLQRQTPAPAPTPAPTAAPAGRPPNDQEIKIITQAESDRMKLLSTALPLVNQLIAYIIYGDSSVTRDPRGKKAKKDAPPGLDVTKRAAVSHLNVQPNTYDWLNDSRDREALDTLTVVARLMAENLGRPIYPKRIVGLPYGRTVPDACGKGKSADNDGARVNFTPDFFVSTSPPLPDPMCPGVILMHEYFHHQVVNPQDPPLHQGKVFHGGPDSNPFHNYYPDTTKYAIHDAYSLTGFVVHVALAREFDCVCSPSTPATPGAGHDHKTSEGFNDGVAPSQALA